MVQLLNTHPNATMALLENIGEIAKFFGRKETTSFLLPLLVTCLNASDWRTKRAFLSNISDVAMECGASVTESFVVPCAERFSERSARVAAASCHEA